MNSVIFVFLCATIFAAAFASESDTYKLQYKKYHNECQSSTNTDPLLIAKVIRGENFDGKVLGPHLLCINKKFNIQNENGDINTAELRTSLNNLFNKPDKTEDALSQCVVRAPGATPEEVAVSLVKCTQRYITLKVEIPANAV